PCEIFKVCSTGFGPSAWVTRFGRPPPEAAGAMSRALSAGTSVAGAGLVCKGAVVPFFTMIGCGTGLLSGADLAGDHDSVLAPFDEFLAEARFFAGVDSLSSVLTSGSGFAADGFEGAAEWVLGDDTGVAADSRDVENG